MKLQPEVRLKNVLVSDKEENPTKVLGVLKSDILNVLSEYMEISSDDLILNINVNNLGQFVFSCSATIRRLKNLSRIIE